jgi:hypothetical protein
MEQLSLAYPARRLIGDYVRAASGLLLTAGPAVLLPAGSYGFILLGAGAALFAALAGQTCLRQLTSVRVDEEGIEAGPGGTRIRWRDLSGVKLSYFSTRRDGRGGWMQLSLQGGRGRIRLDSRLEGFETVVGLAARWALENRIALSPASTSNLKALGLGVSPVARESPAA